MKKTKHLFWAASVFLFTGSQTLLLAQSAGNAKTALDTATSTVKSLFGSATNLMYAVAAVIAIIGAIKVYLKWQHDDPNILKSVSGWFAAAVFIALVSTILKAFFGV